MTGSGNAAGYSRGSNSLSQKCRPCSKNYKVLTRGRTDHRRNILAGRQVSAGCYLFPVSNNQVWFSAVELWSVIPFPLQHVAEHSFSACDLELCPMTLTFEYDLDSIKMNENVKRLGHGSVSSKVIVRTDRDTHTRTHTHTPGPIIVRGPLTWSVKIRRLIEAPDPTTSGYADS